MGGGGGTPGARVVDPAPAGAEGEQAPDAAEDEAVQAEAGRRPDLPPRPSAEAPDEEVDEKAVDALYQRAYAFVEDVMGSARQGRSFSVDLALAIVSRIVSLKGATDLLYRQAIYARETPEELHGFSSAVVTHSVNVAVYALRIGEGMDFEQHRLTDLGVAALLHDIGMTRLPDTIIESKGKLSDQEVTEMRKHPLYAYQILAGLGDDYLWLADVAYQEHERDNRSGFPRGHSKDHIT